MAPAKLLGLMARKENIAHGKNAAHLRGVAEGLSQTQALEGQLTALLDTYSQALAPDMSVQRLKATHWLAGQIAQQIEATSARKAQLDQDMQLARAALGQSEHRRQLYQQRAQDARRAEAMARDEKSRADLPATKR